LPTLRLIFGAALVAGAAAPLIAAPAEGSHRHANDGAETYVVAFDRGPDAARRAVDASGGTVLDVNEDLGVALVRAVDDGFRHQLGQLGGIEGVVLNHSVGLLRKGMPHRYAEERPRSAHAPASAGRSSEAAAAPAAPAARGSDEPLGGRQWDLAMLGVPEAHQRATGAGVDVGIIDTGIDGSHPDIAPNFDAGRSRNFTTDIPAVDGPCEVPSCVDPADVDGKGHGTHVAGTIAAARNGLGISGIAPDARLVNLRAGQDSGYFFLYETLNALTAAGDLHLDVVNMSFYTDPWLYNCDSPDDYIEGKPSADDLAQQRLTRKLVVNGLRYAHDRGVTLVAAAGNEHADLAAPTRFDPFSPGYPPGTSAGRLVTKDCVDLPNEGPSVISVGSVGPSGTKADYSNYGFGVIDVTAPGGWLRDRVGTPGYQQPANMILSTYPQAAAIEEGLADADGQPTDGFSIRQCNALGVCGFYSYLQGTSMAAPHVAGVAALIVQRFGQGSALQGYSLAPDQVAAILQRTARDHACPANGVVTYRNVGRPASWNAVCQGDAANNGIYGAGIVDAAAATR